MTEKKVRSERGERGEHDEIPASDAGNQLMHRSAALAQQAQRDVDKERGYTRRVLGNGTVDFMALHDQWTNPDEREVQDHVQGYRNKLMNFAG